MQLVTDGVSHRVLVISVGRGRSSAELVVYALANEADSTARKMSALVPGKVVHIECSGQMKARYRNGGREGVYDFKESFPFMTDEEYEETKIWCSVNSEWI